MNIRSLERSVIRNRCIKRDGNAKNFRAEWRKHCRNKHPDAEVRKQKKRSLKSRVMLRNKFLGGN